MTEEKSVAGKTASKTTPVAVKKENKSAPAPKAEKKPKKGKVESKEKVVRDSFTMPQTDYDLIAELKQAALEHGQHLKKSEILRAGLHALAKLNTTQFKLAISSLEKIKTGRPKKA